VNSIIIEQLTLVDEQAYSYRFEDMTVENLVSQSPYDLKFVRDGDGQ